MVIDVSALIEPDAGTVDALARLQLIARRHGVSLRLRHPCPRLQDLLALTGLAGVLPVEEAVDGEGPSG